MLNKYPFFLLVFPAATQPWKAHRVETTSTPQTIAQLEKAVQHLLRQTTTPIAENAIVDEKGMVWVTTLEVADSKTNRPASSQIIFSVGSSKMFVAMAVLKLQEESHLHLKDKPRNLAPEINYENRWNTTFPVLVEHLREHTTRWDDLHFRGWLNQ